MGKRGPKSIFTDAQWRWIADRYREGYTKSEISKFLGVHFSTVWIHLQNIVEPKDLPPLSERKDEFVKLYGDGGRFQ